MTLMCEPAEMKTSDITVAELRAALDRLLNAVEARFGPELSFPEDYYWNIQFDSATTTVPIVPLTGFQ